MMPEEPESWAKYGFPDPTLYPPYLPVAGLIKALDERRSVAGLSPVSFLTVPEYFTILHEGESSVRSYFSWLDLNILAAAENYINPSKIADYDGHSSTLNLRWNEQDLISFVTNGHPEEFVYSAGDNPSMLTPNFSAKWAKQRYKMINALYLAPNNVSFTAMDGWSEYSNTKRDAFNSAISRMQGIVSFESAGLRFYGVDLGEGLPRYGMEIRYHNQATSPVFTSYPAVVDSWLIMFIEAYYTFNSGGYNIQLGKNVFKADANGLYFDFPANSMAYPSDWEQDQSSTFYQGWRCTYTPLAYSDFRPAFNFKET